MAQQLSPELLALLMGGPPGGQQSVMQNGAYYMPEYASYSQVGPDSEMQQFSGVGPITAFTGGVAPGSDIVNVYDPQGNFTGTRDTSLGPLWKDIATWAAMAGGANLLGGALTGAGAAGGLGTLASEAAPTWDAATSAAWQSGAGLGGDTLSAMGMGEAAGAAGAGAAALGNADKAALLGGSGYGPGMTGAQTAAADAALAGGGGALSKLKDFVTGGAGLSDWAKLGLGIAGALDSRGGKSTTTKDPWQPAQPFLLGQLQRGERMQQQLEAQPFSPAQQQAYGNVAGLLNLANSQAPAMLAAQGNVPQFKRGGGGLLPPRGTGMDAAALNQGLLQFFGGR